MDDFFQTGPVLQNQFCSDSALQSCLRRLLPTEVQEEITSDLEWLGQVASREMPPLAAAAEAQPPEHIPFDAWGRRVDEIRLSSAWEQLRRIAAREGIVATAYERRHGAFSRIHQLAKLYLYSPSSAIFSCPLAMTDGAARVLEQLGPGNRQQNALKRLISRDPDEFWTSGQWMTERAGGSDVGKSLTIAEPGNIDGQWLLSGNKWFTSAVTSEMALTLARTDTRIPGTRGLSLFYVELRDPQGQLRGIRVHRLKDKLGTRALPTAELELNRTPATMLGDPGNGVRKAASLLNITRTYNSVCALGYMRRGIALARDYATRREAFGRPLSKQPLHLETLAALQTELEAGMQLTMRVAELLGREECGEASESDVALLRILTPLTKLFTGKQGVAVCSEVLECFGGAGYVEDTGLPSLLRDAQVLPIWEGTTNILSLDVLRAGEKEGALQVLLDDSRNLLQQIRSNNTTQQMTETTEYCEQSLRRLTDFAMRLSELSGDAVQAGARQLSLGLAQVYAGILLARHAVWSAAHEGQAAGPRITSAHRWCRKPLQLFLDTTADELQDTAALALS